MNMTALEPIRGGGAASNSKCINGFTLAEVLITLGIIGVVAALTMPALMQSYQKKVTLERLKQTYSILSQAIRTSEAHNGELKDWDMTGVSDTYNASSYPFNEVFATKYIMPYLNVVKVCGHATTDCWGNDYKFLNGSADNYRNGRYNHSYSFVLANGVTVGIWARNSWAEIWVDINGGKAPNITGIDTFNLVLNKSTAANGVQFYGYSLGKDRNYYKNQYKYPCNKTGTLAGVACGALIFVDGWEIKNDYPW